MKKKILFFGTKIGFDRFIKEQYHIEGFEYRLIDGQKPLHESIAGVEVAGFIIHESCEWRRQKELITIIPFLKSRIR